MGDRPAGRPLAVFARDVSQRTVPLLSLRSDPRYRSFNRQKGAKTDLADAKTRIKVFGHSHVEVRIS